MISRRQAIIAFAVLFLFALFSAITARNALDRAIDNQHALNDSVCQLSAKRWEVTHDLAKIVTQPVVVPADQTDDARLVARIAARNAQLTQQRYEILAKLGPKPVCK